jgi:hypothetical protein
MLRRVALERTEVSEKRSASIFEVTRIGMRLLLVRSNVVPSSSILVTLIMEAIRSSETSVLTRAKRRNIPEDGIIRVYFCVWYSFLLEAEQTSRPSEAGRIEYIDENPMGSLGFEPVPSNLGGIASKMEDINILIN